MLQGHAARDKTDKRPGRSDRKKARQSKRLPGNHQTSQQDVKKPNPEEKTEITSHTRKKGRGNKETRAAKKQDNQTAAKEKNEATPEFQQPPTKNSTPKPKRPTWLWQSFHTRGTQGQPWPTNAFKCSGCETEIEIPDTQKPEPCESCNRL